MKRNENLIYYFSNSRKINCILDFKHKKLKFHKITIKIENKKIKTIKNI